MTQQKEVKLGATVPQDWANKLEILAKKSGYSVNELVREAVAQYLGIDNTAPGVLSQLDEFYSELKLLKQKVTEVELYKHQIKDLSIRLSVVEQDTGKLKSQGMFSSHQSPSEAWLIDPNEDDFEDEPDEILSDFVT